MADKTKKEREAELKAHQEAEEKARLEREELARKEAEEAELKAHQEAEEKARTTVLIYSLLNDERYIADLKNRFEATGAVVVAGSFDELVTLAGEPSNPELKEALAGTETTAGCTMVVVLSGDFKLTALDTLEKLGQATEMEKAGAIGIATAYSGASIHNFKQSGGFVQTEVVGGCCCAMSAPVFHKALMVLPSLPQHKQKSMSKLNVLSYACAAAGFQNYLMMLYNDNNAETIPEVNNLKTCKTC